MTRFSVCIPNYNYAGYVGETVESVLTQVGADVEVLVSDNASTDASVGAVEALGDPRVHVTVNRCNVGFAGNLDRAARRATGDVMILLSSDDLMRPGALDAYHRLFRATRDVTSVVTSAVEVIDSDGNVTGRNGADPELWDGARRDADLERELGAPVLQMPAADLLRRCLATMRNPFNFLATAYPRSLYEEVEGYGGGRLMNPDKWFHWRILGAADVAYFVDLPLFAYRWHASNQTAIQASQGALKFLVDDYVNTFEVGDDLLSAARVTRQEVVAAFVEHDIARHGLATLARGDGARARRILRFGLATYPATVRRSRNAQVLRALLATGPLGRRVAASLYARRSAAASGADGTVTSL